MTEAEYKKLLAKPDQGQAEFDLMNEVIVAVIGTAMNRYAPPYSTWPPCEIEVNGVRRTGRMMPIDNAQLLDAAIAAVMTIAAAAKVPATTVVEKVQRIADIANVRPPSVLSLYTQAQALAGGLCEFDREFDNKERAARGEKPVALGHEVIKQEGTN